MTSTQRAPPRHSLPAGDRSRPWPLAGRTHRARRVARASTTRRSRSAAGPSFRAQPYDGFVEVAHGLRLVIARLARHPDLEEMLARRPQPDEGVLHARRVDGDVGVEEHRNVTLRRFHGKRQALAPPRAASELLHRPDDFTIGVLAQL